MFSKKTSHQITRGFIAILCVAALAACSSTPISKNPPKEKSFLDKALGLIGLQTAKDDEQQQNADQKEKPELKIPDFGKKEDGGGDGESGGMPKMGKVSIKELQKLKTQQTLHATLPIHILGSAQLNTMADGQALPLIVKVYKLKGEQNFKQIPLNNFVNGEIDNDEILSTKEIILRPGKDFEYTEKLDAETSHVAVVGLFQRPGGLGWRKMYSIDDLQDQGLTILAGSCGMQKLDAGVSMDAALQSTQGECG